MTTVYKYDLTMSEVNDIVHFDMPAGARILSAGNQRERLCVWAEVDPARRPVSRRFRVAGTGHPLKLPVNAVFVGTVLFMHGELVLHVYDLGEVG